MNIGDEMFIGFPEATLKKTPGGSKIKKVLWGDWCEIADVKTNHCQIKCRGVTGWVRKTDLQSNRLLEVNFVDVGQGDGVFVVTPKDEFILVDAGAGDNISRFLSWRFNLLNNTFKVPIKYLVITHPDKDHYQGFKPIVSSNRYAVETIYHKGIVERKGSKRLGSTDRSETFLTDIKDTHTKVRNLVKEKSNRGGMLYPNLLWSAIVVLGFSISQLLSLLEAVIFLFSWYVLGKEECKTWFKE